MTPEQREQWIETMCTKFYGLEYWNSSDAADALARCMGAALDAVLPQSEAAVRAEYDEQMAMLKEQHATACEHFWLTYKAGMSLTSSDDLTPGEKPWDDVQRRIEALNDAIGQTEQVGDALYMAWVIIANANGGDWSKADPEWVAAAERWRDEFHRLLDTGVVPKREEDGPAERVREIGASS